MSNDGARGEGARDHHLLALLDALRHARERRSCRGERIRSAAVGARLECALCGIDLRQRVLAQLRHAITQGARVFAGA